MEPLSADQVRHIARLSRLALTDEEVEADRERLTALLGYAERIASLPLEGVEPLVHPTLEDDEEQTLRPDEPGAPFASDVIKGLAPATDGPYVRVPKVLGDGGGA
ncbi:MAG: Asp-tRNA(Asn)/Glu-tRNA(Gln) amidotransferase subunit GatC [Planctomycetota bacterium]